MATKNMKNKIPNIGLLELPKDSRDFSHSVVFGSISQEDLPSTDFFASQPLEIKDQDYQVPNTDFCAGYAAAEVSEDQEDVLLNPEYTWIQAKKLIGGNAWEQWGLNLRDICLAAIKKGFLEQEYYPFENRTELTRDYIANPKNWPEDLDMLAAEHRKNSFFAVDGPHDTFDNMRSVLYMNRAEHRSILTGVSWHSSWTSASRGIIPETGWQNDATSGHAIKIFGQMWLEDADTKIKSLCLVAQLSNGLNIGDGGIFYFPRSVVNSQFIFGAFTFKDMPKDLAQYHNENGLALTDSALFKLWRVLLNWFLSLITKKS